MLKKYIFNLYYRSKVTKYIRYNNIVLASFHLLGGHNALNLTTTTVYLLAAVTFTFLDELMANLFAA